VKVKLDENLTVEAVAVFAEFGHDVRTVSDEGLTGARDEVIRTTCRRFRKDHGVEGERPVGHTSGCLLPAARRATYPRAARPARPAAAFPAAAGSVVAAATSRASYDVTRAGAVEWSGEAASHLRNRSSRRAGADDIEPDWTVEAVNDPDRIVDEPDPRSAHANSVCTVGYSATAGTVLTVVALRGTDGTLHGTSAWRTTGRPKRQYGEGRRDD
jgi:hypothetical protein